MAKRIRHTSKLLYHSFKAVRQHKKLFIFPALASIIVVLLLTFVITPLVHYEQSLELINKGHLHHVGWFYVGVLIFLFIMHQVLFYFNAALTACIEQYFQKKKPSLRDGFKAANKSLWKFYLWNSFAGTLGIIFTLFQGTMKKYPFYQKMFQGLRWTTATYFATPIIVANNTGPYKTIQQSVALITSTWGTNVRPNFGFIPLMILTRFLLIIPIIVGLIVGGKIALIVGSSVTVALMLIIFMFNAATRTALCSALYLYATEGTIAPGYKEELIKKAFRTIQQ